MINDSIEDIQKKCLMILKEVIRICEKNDIKYYLVGGSALGAYRHKGFIPWDDDIDIAIPRIQYAEFINCCKKDLHKKFYLQDTSTEDQFIFPFIKIRMRETAYVDKDLAHIHMHHGIFLDVFPLDNVPDGRGGQFYQKNGLKVCNAIRMAKLKLKSPSLLKNVILVFMRHFFPGKYLEALYMHFMLLAQDETTLQIGNLVGAYDYGKEALEREVFGEGILLEFEDIYCRVPSQIENFLRGIYGTTYMQLPSIDKRKTHNPIVISFSDEYTPRRTQK